MKRLLLMIALVGPALCTCDAGTFGRPYYAASFQLCAHEMVLEFSFTGEEPIAVSTVAVSASLVEHHASLAFVATRTNESLRLALWRIVCHVAPLSFTPSDPCG
jgi:hypothetical protein